jgi:hypothetical protein
MNFISSEYSLAISRSLRTAILAALCSNGIREPLGELRRQMRSAAARNAADEQRVRYGIVLVTAEKTGCRRQQVVGVVSELKKST